MIAGLIAGYGEIPRLAYERLKAQFDEIVVITIAEEVSEDFSLFADKIYSFSAGQVGKIIKTLKKEGVKKLLFAGKVNKTLLYRNLKFDLKALKILFSLKDRNDDTIMLRIVDELEKEGISVLEQTDVLKDLLIPAGILSKKKADKKQYGDIIFGYKVAKELGRVDIGQTVVVKNRTVMAVEAIEGTDAAIERGCKLAGKGAVVVKVSKPNQDKRFDVPTVGIDTLKKICENSGVGLAVEAYSTFGLNIEEMVEYCNKNDLLLMSFDGEKL